MQNKINKQGILLDTHVWLWYVNGEKELTKKAIKTIDETAENNAVFVSMISVWEIVVLETKKKIKLHCDCQSWIKSALALPGIELTTCSIESTIASYQQLPDFHGDPADRILAATAAIENLTLMTRDQKILSYGQKNHISVFPA